MKRDPSLHVRKSDLIRILSDVNFSRKSSKEIAEEIFRLAGPYQIKTRYLKILDLKSKLKSKVEKSLKADENVPDKLVETFNLLLLTTRKKMNPNIKVYPILKDSKDYLMLKEVAKLAHNFAEHFDIVPRKDGYVEYINIGLSKMAKYSLNRFKYYDSKIVEHFQNKLEVLHDDDRDATMEMYVEWQSIMLEYSGIEEIINIEDNYDKFVHIVYARRDADKYSADYNFWIKAQFEELAFLKALPELSQLYGENAYNRFERFLKKSIDNEETKKDSDVRDYYDR